MDNAESSSVNITKKQRVSNPTPIFSEHNYASLDPQKKKKQKSENPTNARQAASRKELSLQEKEKVILELQNQLGEIVIERGVINSSFSRILKELNKK